MKPRHLVLSLGVIVLGMVVMVRAGDNPRQTTPGTGAQVKDELASKEQQLARQFEEFRSQLLRLQQRLNKGNAEEKARAKALGKLLEQIQKDGLTIQFEQLADLLRQSKLSNIPELQQMAERSANLADKLRDYLRMFQEDPRLKQLKSDTDDLKKMIDDVSKILDAEKRIQGLTEAGKTDPKELQKNQEQNAAKTNKLEKDIDKFIGKGDGGLAKDAKDLKGGIKDGGKTDTAKANPKDDGDDKNAQANSPGKAKDGGDDDKPGSPSKGEAKADESGKDPKAGQGEAQAKDGKNDDGKPGAEGSKAKDGKGSEAAQGSQAKGNEGAKGKEAGAKGNEGAKGKEAGAKGDESKGGEKPSSQAKGNEGQKPPEAGAKDAKGSDGAKASDAKSAGKPSEGSPSKGQGEAKPGSESKGQGEAKSDGKSSPGSPPPGQQASAKNEPPPSGDEPPPGDAPPPPPGNQKAKDELAKNKKQIAEAGYEMKDAAKKLGDNKLKQAIPPEEKAIQNLEVVKQALEKLLRQTREEELERLLAALEARCKKMLEMQIQVLAGTEQTHKAMLAHPNDKNALRQDQIHALKLSDNEKDIIAEANKAIQMLEEEGSAVAFPEVFQQVREDMKLVQRRLEIADVGDVTQAVEKDIIASLQEMIDALKKAQADLDKQKNGKPKEGQPPPNADQKLLDKIAELKMIRALQSRINDRTRFFGKLFPNEQALDPTLRQSLQQLGERQERIFEIMDRFAKGDGK